ncbi:EpsG family protein [Halopseudomonas pelagia]|uniref:EpsG family protein n=1 Tax=Halopseudomonas pelagia TaxID=553151 RepID=A0AA91U0E4_9GAMM|nr:EpsG family protein [Halopseudomonas pelagia]PCC98438.1 hypothetical protein CO192_15840 [Halopseudomonas pelagia]QFY57710.1 EpsG family protein [Halopseudomonas pelagia]
MQYIVFILIASLLSFVRRSKLDIVFVVAIAFILFSFFTKEGSWDYYGYQKYFLCAIESNCAEGSFEKSFSLVSLAAGKLLGDYAFEAVILLYVTLSIIIKFKLFYKHSAWVGVSIFSYACYGFFLGEMTQLRASMAIAICWWSLSEYSSGKRVHAALLLALATFFHVSSVLALVIPLLKLIKIKTLVVVVCFSAVLGYLVAASTSIPLMRFGFERIDVYLAAMGSESLTAKQLNLYAIVMLLTALFAMRQKDSEIVGFDRLCIKAVLFGVSFYLLFFFVPIIPLRVLEFYTSVYPFIVAAIFKSNRSLVVRCGFVFIYILLFANLAIKNNTRMDLVYDWQSIPYDNMSQDQLEQFNRYSD